MAFVKLDLTPGNDWFLATWPELPPDFVAVWAAAAWSLPNAVAVKISTNGLVVTLALPRRPKKAMRHTMRVCLRERLVEEAMRREKQPAKS